MFSFNITIIRAQNSDCNQDQHNRCFQKASFSQDNRLIFDVCFSIFRHTHNIMNRLQSGGVRYGPYMQYLLINNFF